MMFFDCKLQKHLLKAFEEVRGGIYKHTQFESYGTSEVCLVVVFHVI